MFRCALFLLTCLMSVQALALPKLAVVSTSGEPMVLAELLSIRLGNRRDCVVLERVRIRQILREQKLSAALAQASPRRTGRLLGTDVLVVLDSWGESGQRRVRVRVFETESGILLADRSIRQNIHYGVVVGQLRDVCLSGLSKAGSNFRGVRLALIDSKQQGTRPAHARLERTVVLLETLLVNSASLVVLERRHLGQASVERLLSGQGKLSSAQALLLVSVDAGAGKLWLELRRNGQPTLRKGFAVAEIPTASDMQSILVWLNKRLQVEIPPFDRDTESLRFYLESQSERVACDWSQALSNAYAAYALSPDECEFIQNLLDVLLSKAGAIMQERTPSATKLRQCIDLLDQAISIKSRLLRDGNRLAKSSKYSYLRAYPHTSDVLRMLNRLALVRAEWPPELEPKLAQLADNCRRRLSKEPSLGSISRLARSPILNWGTSSAVDYGRLVNWWMNRAVSLTARELLEAEPMLGERPLEEVLLRQGLHKRPDCFAKWSVSANPFVSHMGRAIDLLIRPAAGDSESVDEAARLQRDVLAAIDNPKESVFWRTPAEARQLLCACLYLTHRIEIRNLTQGGKLAALERTALIKRQRLAIIEMMIGRREFAPWVRTVFIEVEDKLAEGERVRLLRRILSALDRNAFFWGTAFEKEVFWFWARKRLADFGHGKRGRLKWRSANCVYTFSNEWWSKAQPQISRVHNGWLYTVLPAHPLRICVLEISTGRSTEIRVARDANALARGIEYHRTGLYVMTRDHGLYLLDPKRKLSVKQRLPVAFSRNVESFTVLDGSVYLKCGSNPNQTDRRVNGLGSIIARVDLQTGKAEVLADSARSKRMSSLDRQQAFSVPYMTNRNGCVFFTLTYNVLDQVLDGAARPGLWTYNAKQRFRLLQSIEFSTTAASNVWVTEQSLQIQSAEGLLLFDLGRPDNQTQLLASRTDNRAPFVVSDYLRGVQAYDGEKLWFHADEGRRLLKVVLPDHRGQIVFADFLKGKKERLIDILPAPGGLVAISNQGVYRLLPPSVLPKRKADIVLKRQPVAIGDRVLLRVATSKKVTELRWYNKASRAWGAVPVHKDGIQDVSIAAIGEDSRDLRLTISAYNGNTPLEQVRIHIVMAQLCRAQFRKVARDSQLAVAELAPAKGVSGFLKQAGVPFQEIGDPGLLAELDAPGVMISTSWMKANHHRAIPHIRRILDQGKRIIFFGVDPVYLWESDFPLPVPVREFSPADAHHFMSNNGRWPSRWPVTFEGQAHSWATSLGNFRPLLDDNVGRRVIAEFYPRKRGRVLLLACPIARDLRRHPVAARLLLRMVEYVGRPWQDVGRRRWQGIDLQVTDKRLADAVKGMRPDVSQKGVTVLSWSRRLASEHAARLSDGAVYVMLAPFRGVSKGQQLDRRICDGFSDAWMNRVSSLIPEESGRWSQSFGRHYREELIPGMLACVHYGNGQLYIMAVPPKTEHRKVLQEHLAVLLTSLNVRLAEVRQ